MVLVYTESKMNELTKAELDGLFELYVAECDRDKSAPSFKDFNIWLVENGYIDD